MDNFDSLCWITFSQTWRHWKSLGSRRSCRLSMDFPMAPPQTTAATNLATAKTTTIGVCQLATKNATSNIPMELKKMVIRFQSTWHPHEEKRTTSIHLAGILTNSYRKIAHSVVWLTYKNASITNCEKKNPITTLWSQHVYWFLWWKIPMNSMVFSHGFSNPRRLSDAGDRRGEGADGGQAWRWSPKNGATGAVFRKWPNKFGV